MNSPDGADVADMIFALDETVSDYQFDESLAGPDDETNDIVQIRIGRELLTLTDRCFHPLQFSLYFSNGQL